MTKSEKFVADLCKKSFLPFWSFPSPVGKKGNELCDLLVVCQNTVIIISVKDIEPSKHEDELILYKRWMKKAITQSISQILGAEQYISKVDLIQIKNSNYVITLPPKEERIIHRIAIAFGSKDNYIIPTGYFKEKFVNIFNETATETILEELDTITDFTNYLIAKQKFGENKLIWFPSEVDLLAFYLQTGLSFTSDKSTVIIGDTTWKEYIESEDYKQLKLDIEVSYILDMMIQSFYIDIENNLIPVEKRNEIERATRIINLESRRNRIQLGLNIEQTFKNKLKTRMFKSNDAVDYGYVFMPLNADNWERKEDELGLRCDVARVDIPDVKKVIGIAIGGNSMGGITFDLHYVDLPEISDEFINYTKLIKEKLGYFVNVKQSSTNDENNLP